MFSVCSHLGGGGGGQLGGVRSRGGQPAGGSGPGGVRSQGGGSGPGGSAGGVRSWGGQVPGGGGVQVSPAGGGVRSRGGGQVPGGSAGGGSGPEGGVRILHPLAGGMPLAFTQEDFLVKKCILLL